MDGQRFRLYCFIMVRCYSRVMYLEFVTATDMRAFVFVQEIVGLRQLPCKHE